MKISIDALAAALPPAPAPMSLRVPIARGETRSAAQLLEHYIVERELAARLSRASAAERRELYARVYDELYQRVRDHPMNRPGADRSRDVENALAFLRRFLAPGASFMEIGAGDCALSRRVAGTAGRVVAVDVSAQIMRGERAPANVCRIVCDGRTIPVAEGSIDVAFSDQLMEHLHPDDALAQLREIHRVLAPGGVYVCVTPNRLYGPRDISMYFDDVATGLHLREYTVAELVGLQREVGFSAWTFFAGGRGHYVRVPAGLPLRVENVLAKLGVAMRRRIADTAALRAVLGIRLAAFKPA